MLPTPAFYETNKQGSSDGLRSPTYSSRVSKVRGMDGGGGGRGGGGKEGGGGGGGGKGCEVKESGRECARGCGRMRWEGM